MGNLGLSYVHLLLNNRGTSTQHVSKAFVFTLLLLAMLSGCTSSESVNLGSKINTPAYEGRPCIAADESYLLYEKNEEGLMVNFNQPDGTWGEPINVSHAINSHGNQDRFPKLSNDENILFFGSNARDGSDWFAKPQTLDEIKTQARQPGNGFGDIYWVDASIIDRLRPHPHIQEIQTLPNCNLTRSPFLYQSQGYSFGSCGPSFLASISVLAVVP